MEHTTEMQKLDELLGEYWDTAYAEGREGRAHDTPEGRAQRALHAIHAHVASMVREAENRGTVAAGVEKKD